MAARWTKSWERLLPALRYRVDIGLSIASCGVCGDAGKPLVGGGSAGRARLMGSGSGMVAAGCVADCAGLDIGRQRALAGGPWGAARYAGGRPHWRRHLRPEL